MLVQSINHILVDGLSQSQTLPNKSVQSYLPFCWHFAVAIVYVEKQ